MKYSIHQVATVFGQSWWSVFDNETNVAIVENQTLATCERIVKAMTEGSRVSESEIVAASERRA